MPKIQTIHVFIAIDKNPDDEGVVAMKVGNNWIPLVAADEARIKSLKPIAQRIATITKQKIILAKFSVRENVETINPEKREK
jgi:hypothetical protein